ncbi:galactose-1-phosphate uridylyltransferase [Luedemannella flava]|uniref:Galactose-1-phosphate uridylyltransferase n=1 Tax=Luedemannella flava TaxID=349316 RepID=A0ABP4XN27_9ACTN
MRRTVTTLADGRELIYFDEPDASGAYPAERASVVDTRPLDPRPLASQLRYDPLLDEWVAIAAHRQTRIFLPSSDECPLCPSTPAHASEVPAASYDVAVFENRFPSFSDNPAEADLATDAQITPLTPVRPGGGRCEVVCFTSEHTTSFAELSPARARTVLDAQADRTAALSARDDVEQVFCFENRGVEIGVTLHHPHGQIYGYPFVTPRTRTMLDSAVRYAAAHNGANLFGDILAAERASGERVVLADDHWTAYVPAAARWPFEVHVVPHRQVPDLPALTHPERDAFAGLYLRLLRAFDGLFSVPMPYISAWYQAPVRSARELAWLHLQLFSIRRAAGKLKYLAGSESAMGVFINDVRPEEAAKMLREALR